MIFVTMTSNDVLLLGVLILEAFEDSDLRDRNSRHWGSVLGRLGTGDL